MPSAGAKRCRGAIAIMFALSVFFLFGFLALAIDLGRTYVVRTELQNAADAAALAGAQELNHTVAGINNAITAATAIAAQNNFLFATPVSITSANLAVGNCPDDACMVPIASITSNALASGMTFLRVNIPSENIPTWFAALLPNAISAGLGNTTTFGRAVAGRFVNDVTPVGVCGIRDATGTTRPRGEVIPGTNELMQFGFRRGVSYNIFRLGNLGSPSVPYLINPVDTYPNSCNPSNSSASATAPFVCSGSSAVLPTTPGIVYGNTGVSGGAIQAALNSRFNVYGGPSQCNPLQSPPDTNITPYHCTGAGCGTPAANWMTPPRQTLNLAGIATPGDYGVLWSYSRAVSAVGTAPNAQPGTPFSTANWSTLYPSPAGSPVADADFPANGSPYTNGVITPPVGNTGRPDRRVLNLAIVDCPNVVAAGSCSQLPVLGVGRFFMQTPANVNGGPNAELNVEFAGLIEPVPVVQVMLYR